MNSTADITPQQAVQDAINTIEDHDAPAVTSDTLATKLNFDISNRTELHQFRRVEYALIERDNIEFEPTADGDLVWWTAD